jgi:superfamily II DNA or RNA helicase
MASKKRSPEPPPAQDWRTTDADEILRRRLRAREGRFRVENTTPAHPVHSTFLVHSARDRRYLVEIRDARSREAVCECVDFRVNGLGTCKHAEAVWLHVAKKAGAAYRVAREKGSDRFEVVWDRAVDALRLAVPGEMPVPKSLQRWFGADGTVTAGADFEAVVAELRDLARGRMSRLRVSLEVEEWLVNRRRAAERVRLRREYEVRVQSGEWPQQETLVPLFPYQREGMLHLAFKERALLADEMGLGKTIQAVAACALLSRLGCARRVLVVTPASLKAEWEEQIRRFTRLSSHLVYGARHQRLAFYRAQARSGDASEPLAPDSPFFIVMNYEQVVPDLTEINALLRPDVVVLDEAQRIKNWNTKTAMAIKRLNSRFAFVLSGTPIENRIDELRSLVDFLDPSVLGPLFRFNREFYELDPRGRPIGYRNLTRLHERVRPLMLRRRKADVETELPPRTDRNLFVPMSESQRRAYSAHEQEVMKFATIAERRPLLPREQERLHMELAMMRMVCDTPYILDAKDRTCPKLAEIGRILEECRENDAKVIVFSEWERMLELVREWCEEQGMGFAWHTGSVPQQLRRQQINLFKEDPACRVFLSTDSGATGLNLQVASVVVNCDLPWTPTRLEQRIARAWRKNQLRNVTVINLISENTLEQRMLETLAIKRTVAASVLDQPGVVDSIELRPGRKAMVERVRELVGVPAIPGASGAAATPGFIDGGKPKGSRDPREAYRRDPAAAFARYLAQRLGATLVACEERIPQGGGPAVLCLVVTQDAEAHRQHIGQLRGEFCRWMGDGQTLGDEDSELLRFEVLDRATFDALARFAAAGLIAPTLATTRPLSLDAEPQLPPPLTAEELERIRVRADKARHSLRRARVLGEADFPEECRVSVLEAIWQVACVLALRERHPEPADLDAALAREDPGTWKRCREVAAPFVADSTVEWEPVAAALEKAIAG